MTRAPFTAFSGFIETGFEQRFQGLLRLAHRQRSWHVIVAEPGSGKSMGIRDLVESSARARGTLSGRNYPLLAVTAPKNDPREQALGNYLLLALGMPARGRWSDRKYTMIALLQHFGVECIIVDDAHDLSLQHLILLKELSDQLRLPPHNHALGLCLVTAGRGAAMPLKDVFEQPETMWMQFRRRLDSMQPYCRIASHTQEEVRDILGTLEQIYEPAFPTLNLRQWTGAVYKWLTHPLLDPQNSGRVLMDNLMKLVTAALEQSYAAGETDISSQRLEAVAELLTLRRDMVRVIDIADVAEAEEPNLATHEQAKDNGAARGPRGRPQPTTGRREMRSDQRLSVRK
jgi:AAA domain